MKRLCSPDGKGCHFPVKVMQFGEGNFLRAFVDWMIDIANEKADFAGSVVIVKPINHGGAISQDFRLQNYRYTVLLRGMVDGAPQEESRIVTSVSDAISCYDDYSIYAEYAKCSTLRFIVSNTTEAGIVLDKEDDFSLCPPKSYPGKLTKFLFQRAEYFDYASDKGIIILPVELIDNNGDELKKCVMQLCKIWNLGDKFCRWLDECCVFASTLVDRIVTGYPRDEAEEIWNKLGYEDHLLDTAEPFGLWVIENKGSVKDELPLNKCGLPVVFADSIVPYKQRKVRILNGAHTSSVPTAFLCGHDIVLEAMHDPTIHNFMQHTLYDEVIPTLDLPENDLIQFASAVESRFANPYIKHSLLAICLNCVSKWRARCLPSLLAYKEKFGTLPEHLVFSLAALLALYHNGKLENGVLVCERDGVSYKLQDDEDVLEFFAERNNCTAEGFVNDFLSTEKFWGQNLSLIPSLKEETLQYYKQILSIGMSAALSCNFPV